MLITLSCRAAICQSVAEVWLTVVAPLAAVSHRFIYLFNYLIIHFFWIFRFNFFLLMVKNFILTGSFKKMYRLNATCSYRLVWMSKFRLIWVCVLLIRANLVRILLNDLALVFSWRSCVTTCAPLFVNRGVAMHSPRSRVGWMVVMLNKMAPGCSVCVTSCAGTAPRLPVSKIFKSASHLPNPTQLHYVSWNTSCIDRIL